MKKLMIILVTLVILAGCGKKEEFNPKLSQAVTLLDLNEQVDPATLIKDVDNAGLQFEVVENTVDTSVPGDYHITYRILSADGRKSIEKTFDFTVKDHDAPVITVDDTITISQGSAFILGSYAKAEDAREGDLTDKLTYTGSLNPFVAGNYTLTLSVADSYGNTATKEVKIVVKAVSPDKYMEMIYGSYTDTTYTDGQAPTLTLGNDGSFNMHVNSCSLLNSIDGRYIMVNEKIYLTSESNPFSTTAEDNILTFQIQLDGTLMFASEMKLCAPNYGDIFIKRSQ